MAKDNKDFLRFSAYSIKDLITRKLSQSTKFTDQVYEGSNLAILIDIFSHMAQCILYSLNNTAGESMFSDTQLYENINRLVKFIGYNPKGYAPSTVELVLDTSAMSVENTAALVLHRYTAIDTGKTDSRGKRIYYSTIDDIQMNTNTEFSVLFYNGIWKFYNQSFKSNGEAYQRFILNGIRSDSEDKEYVADGMIHVYVDEGKDGNIKLEQYATVLEGVFTDNNIDNGSYIYKASQRICNVRLNENKTYELTFGNGFTGYIPPNDSTIYVMYLESNGPDAQLEPNDINGLQAQHDKTLFGVDSEFYEKLFKIINVEDIDLTTGQIDSPLYSSTALWYNTKNSSIAAEEETVDEIRRNAPEWFKTGNRLVTASDYEYYVKNRFRDNIVDVKCQNNWQYISTLYQWLYDLGNNGTRVTFEEDPDKLADKLKAGYRKASSTYYVNQHRLQKHDLKYADAADGNNVYLWLKMKNDSDLYKDAIDEEILNIKALTQEAVYMKPLDVYFSPCAADKDVALKYLIDGKVFDPKNESYIEITLHDNTLNSNNDVQKQVANLIRKFFEEDNFVLGQTVDYSILANQILNLSTVERIRTIWRDQETGHSRILNGLSFATWTAQLIDIGDDIQVSSMSRTLEPFQFPTLYKSNAIGQKIKVIRKSISNVNSLQY